MSLCRFLVDSGQRVIAVSRKESSELKELSMSGLLTIISSSLENLSQSVGELKADVLIHLAWIGTSRSDRDVANVQERNIPISLNLINLAKQMGCLLYVDAGSQAEYGIVTKPISEDTPCQPVTEYGIAKYTLYNQSQQVCKIEGIKYLHLRIFSVFGEMDHPDTLIMTALHTLKAGLPFTVNTGNQLWNYLYVKDAARMIYLVCKAAIQNPIYVSDVYHIASNDTRPLKEFILSIKKTLHSSSPLRFSSLVLPNTVSLNPIMNKTQSVVNPLCTITFEEAIRRMSC